MQLSMSVPTSFFLLPFLVNQAKQGLLLVSVSNSAPWLQ